jgi:hypothetical protein
MTYQADDKIICNNDSVHGLTKGKIYTIIKFNGGFYIKNDNGVYGTYYVGLFISMKRHRNKQLDKIIK